ncbi:MAG: fluoride efflux transporter CrcB [Nitrospirota bacterium]|nr:fluoride efflux transporter CrcB [Nitrospirota bacterium]
MQLLFYIGLFGFVGAISRYLLSGWVYGVMGTRFPYGTLTVNVVGSLLLGFLFKLTSERVIMEADLRTAITVGFLGAFTTFSTFSLETLRLMEEGSWSLAGLNIVANVVVCLVAAWGGIVLARVIA